MAGLVVAAAVSLVLWAAALPLAVSAVGQAGRPGVEAEVVTCSQPGGMSGPCDIRFPRGGLSAEGVSVAAGAQVPLSSPGLFRPEVGDRLEVRLDQDGTAYPVGVHLWLDVAVHLALAVFVTGWVAFWGARVMRALTPVGAQATTSAGGVGYDDRRLDADAA